MAIEKVIEEINVTEKMKESAKRADELSAHIAGMPHMHMHELRTVVDGNGGFTTETFPRTVEECDKRADILFKALEKPDPWIHRSEGMRCRSCMWFVAKDAPGKDMIGRCRRHAPTMSGYPVVFEDDWCGDHKLDEKKV